MGAYYLRLSQGVILTSTCARSVFLKHMDQVKKLWTMSKNCGRFYAEGPKPQPGIKTNLHVLHLSLPGRRLAGSLFLLSLSEYSFGIDQYSRSISVSTPVFQNCDGLPGNLGRTPPKPGTNSLFSPEMSQKWDGLWKHLGRTVHVQG